MISSMTDKEIDSLVNSTNESKLQDFMKEFQKYIPVSGTSPVDKLKVMLKFAFKSLALKESTPVDISVVHDNKDHVHDGKVAVAENAIAIKKENGAVKYIDQDVTLKNEISILQQHIKTMIPSGVHDRLKIRATFLKKKIHKFKSERDTMMLEKHRLAEEVSDLKYDILLEKEAKADAELASLQETKKYEKYRKLFHQWQSKYDTFSNNAIVEQRRLLFEFRYKLQNISCNQYQLELKDMQEKMIQLEIKLKDKEIKENGLDLLKEKEKHIQEMMIDLKAQQKNILDEHARCKEQDKVHFVQQEMRMKELFRHKREEYYALKEKLDIKEDQVEIEELEVKIEMLTIRLKEKDEKIKCLIASNEKLAQQLHACGDGKSKSARKQKKHRKGLSKDDCILCTNHDKIKASEKKEDKGNAKIKQFFGVNNKPKTPKQEKKITIAHVGFHCQFCCAENKSKVQAEPKKEKKELSLRKRKSIQQQMVRNPDFETDKNSVNGVRTSKNQQMFLIREIERAVRFLTEDYNKNNPDKDGKDLSVQGRLLASLVANVGRIKDGMLFEFPAQGKVTVLVFRCHSACHNTCLILLVAGP
ncbi:paramyosin-like [Hydractinia symbiolongicarpus]|uniref:paramyosin-like n=1 Tax=Hydractinia symbiolongicarpus TaxID=13093 RepID=UPI00254E2A26|nr:paramyosin-like [Hydractinia symbiolongicarpus]